MRYLRIYDTLEDHDKLVESVRLLRARYPDLTEEMVLGTLLKIWWHAARHTQSDGVFDRRGMLNAFSRRVTWRPDPEFLLDCLVRAQFIDEQRPEGAAEPVYYFHNWREKYAKGWADARDVNEEKRRQWRELKRAQREEAAARKRQEMGLSEPEKTADYGPDQPKKPGRGRPRIPDYPPKNPTPAGVEFVHFVHPNVLKMSKRQIPGEGILSKKIAHPKPLTTSDKNLSLNLSADTSSPNGAERSGAKKELETGRTLKTAKASTPSNDFAIDPKETAEIVAAFLDGLKAATGRAPTERNKGRLVGAIQRLQKTETKSEVLKRLANWFASREIPWVRDTAKFGWDYFVKKWDDLATAPLVAFAWHQNDRRPALNAKGNFNRFDPAQHKGAFRKPTN